MPESKKFSTVKSRRIRLTVLDDCGAPVIGPRSTIVAGGFTRVEAAHDYQDGTTFEQQDAWGDYCVDERDDPRLRGSDLTVDWCAVDPDVYETTVGSRTLVAVAGDAAFAEVGDSVGLALGTGTVGKSFALEMWTKIANQACAGGNPVWLYTVFPWIKGGRAGDETYELGTTTYRQTARAQGAPAAWGEGPYANPIEEVLAGEVMLKRLTTVQPPAVTNGLIALAEL